MLKEEKVGRSVLCLRFLTTVFRRYSGWKFWVKTNMATDLPGWFGDLVSLFPKITGALFDRFWKFKKRVTAFQIVHTLEGTSFFGDWTPSYYLKPCQIFRVNFFKLCTSLAFSITLHRGKNFENSFFGVKRLVAPEISSPQKLKCILHYV